MIEFKNEKLAVPIVLFAGLVWSFGPLVYDIADKSVSVGVGEDKKLEGSNCRRSKGWFLIECLGWPLVYDESKRICAFRWSDFVGRRFIRFLCGANCAAAGPR